MKQANYIFIFIAIFSIFLAPAYGQGFMVEPMKMEFTIRPGQTIEKVLELRSTGIHETKTLDLKLMELTQSETGIWRVIEPASDVDTSHLSSCLKWIKLSAETVKVKSLEMVPVKVNLHIPRSARGFYAAALTAQTRPKRGRKGITIVFRFLIPILVEIQGRPARQKIELADASMQFLEQSQKNSATTLVSMNIVNKGGTYSRLKGNVNVMWQVGEHWQRVTSAEFREVGIIPGVKLNLESDLKRRLPSGKYELKGTVYVDGRRIRPLVKEIEFVGDPTVTKVAADTPLILEPSTLSIKAIPGSTRTSAIKVRNLSEEAVNVSVDVEVPEPLGNVALGELKGEDLSCAEWIKVIPDSFTVRPGRHRSIRVIARLPKNEKMYAKYYATLVLRAAYTDGQSAGKNTSLILLQNAKIEAKAAAQIMKVSLAAEEGSRYIVRAKSANVGDVHFTPECKAIVTKPDGAPVLESAPSGQGQVMLPLETRDFSGILDFSGVEEGIYRLTVSIDYREKTEEVSKILPIQVSLEEGEKIVTVISVNEE
ncbi:hypothetical protein ES707_11225 [subsurface metagenome]